MFSRALFLSIAVHLSIAPAVAEEAKKASGKPIPAEHKEFVEEFHALLKKHPKAAARFSLADVGEAAPASLPGVPETIYECGFHDDGLGGSYLECDREPPQ